MKFTVKQYAQSLHEVLVDSNPKDHDKIINNFISILKTNEDLSAYEKIIQEVEQLFVEDNQTSSIEVTTANSSSYNPQLVKELNKLAENKVQISNKVDESIIGGVIIRVDDQLIDASIKTQLINLKTDLTQ